MHRFKSSWAFSFPQLLTLLWLIIISTHHPSLHSIHLGRLYFYLSLLYRGMTRMYKLKSLGLNLPVCVYVPVCLLGDWAPLKCQSLQLNTVSRLQKCDKTVTLWQPSKCPENGWEFLSYSNQHISFSVQISGHTGMRTCHYLCTHKDKYVQVATQLFQCWVSKTGRIVFIETLVMSVFLSWLGSTGLCIYTQ